VLANRKVWHWAEMCRASGAYTALEANLRKI
jgi:hypothetical protein